MSEEFCVLNDLFVQFYIVYDETNNPNVLMNIKGYQDKDHCFQWIEELNKPAPPHGGYFKTEEMT